MKSVAITLVSLVALCGAVAPILAGCSDEKTASPPNSPTSAVSDKQAVTNSDGGGSTTTAPPAPGGW